MLWARVGPLVDVSPVALRFPACSIGRVLQSRWRVVVLHIRNATHLSDERGAYLRKEGITRTLHACSYPDFDPRDGRPIPFDRRDLCVLECT